MPNRVLPNPVPSIVPVSKGVRDRISISRSVTLAGYLYAGVVAEAWSRRLNDFLFGLASNGGWRRLGQWLAGEDEASSSPANLFRWIACDIEEASEAMVDADVNLANLRAELRRAQQRRNRLAKSVYRELSRTRQILEQLLGTQPARDYLGLKGPTPRDPATLLHWAQSTITVLSNREQTPAYANAEHGKLNTFELAERLAIRCVPLRQAINATNAAYWAEGIALEAQREAITAFDQVHLCGARVLETFLDVLGLPSLASTVRPGVQRRGRPPKQQPVDAYPDLVEQVLGDSSVELPAFSSKQESSKTASRITVAKDDPTSGEEADPATRGVQEKIERASHKLIFGDWKIGKGVRKLSSGDRKSEIGANKPNGRLWKSERATRKPFWRVSSPPEGSRCRRLAFRNSRSCYSDQ